MTDERIIAYLLEELPEEERERFEDACFAEQEWPEELATVEDDLIEAYLRNQLTPERRQSFEQHYLVTAARQERVAVAAALLRCVDERNTDARNVAPVPLTPEVAPPSNWAERFRASWGRTSWAVRAAAAVMVVILIAGALWVFLPRPPRTFAALTLTLSQSNRADATEVEKVELAANTEALRVTLSLPQPPPEAARYRVELESADGQKQSVEITAQDAQAVRVVIPAARLTRGLYALKLYAIRRDGSEQRVNGSYFFAVQ